MSALAAAREPAQELRWRPLIDTSCYDRSAVLTAHERHALAILAEHRYRWPSGVAGALERLIAPVDDALSAIDSHPEWWGRSTTRWLLVRAAGEHGVAFWGWDREQRLHTLRSANNNYRRAVAAVGYVLCDQRDLHHAFRGWKLAQLTRRVFGTGPVDAALDRVQGYLDGLGRATMLQRPNLQHALYEWMMLGGSPLLEDLAQQSELLGRLRAGERNNARRHGVEQLARTAFEMRVLECMPFQTQPSREEWLDRSQAGEIDVPPVWLQWTRRWFETSTLSLTTRRTTYYALIKAGRWLDAKPPDCADPASWDRELAADWIATVQQLKIGELSKSLNANAMRAERGELLSPRSKASLIGSVRTFFCDLQEWEWIERRFDPRRALGIPRSIIALIGPDPRVIADEVWANLMWAGLNLGQDDLPKHGDKAGTGAPWYPLELVRAVALLWLFAGLRVDEILRLRVGAIRWQTTPDADDGGERVCLLDVPTNKTTSAFTKPVDRLVGEAIDAWQAVRPAQPRFPDRKTGELVDMLPPTAARSLAPSTSTGCSCRCCVARPESLTRTCVVRSRAIARGRRSRRSSTTPRIPCRCSSCRPGSDTRTPAQPALRADHAADPDEGLHRRRLLRPERPHDRVLLDRDATTNGTAAGGGPFEFYDLGHGYCTYTFFEQCPHRMACARCDFYLPKGSSQAQLLEAKDGLQRMLVQIPLTDEERPAVEGDQTAVDRLLAGLTGTPTPAEAPSALGFTGDAQAGARRAGGAA